MRKVKRVLLGALMALTAGSASAGTFVGDRTDFRDETIVVFARRVLYYRSNPHGSEAERLDIVELVDKPLEVAAPVRVAIGNLHILLVPGTYIVGGIRCFKTVA